MKPAWDKLMRQYRNSSTILVADVDCTGAGASLCQQVGVRGYPTIKYGDPSDLQDYKGGRGFEDLAKFARSLEEMCGPAKMEFCSEAQREKIAEYTAMGVDRREALIKEQEAKIAKLESEHKALVDSINAQYKEATRTKDAAVKVVRDGGLSYLKALRALESKATAEL